MNQENDFNYDNENTTNNLIDNRNPMNNSYIKKSTLKEYLSNEDRDELTQKLIMFDKSIMELHQNGYFVVGDMSSIDIINNQITLASFKNKVDYLNSGYNVNGDKKNIVDLCAIGICAYNKFDKFFTNKEFVSYLIDNLEMFLENGNVPKELQEYYIDVFARGNVDYLNNFLLKYNSDKGDTGKNSSRVYNKSTAVGRAFNTEREAAYANILLLPAILALIALIVFFVYFIFFR